MILNGKPDLDPHRLALFYFIGAVPLFQPDILLFRRYLQGFSLVRFFRYTHILVLEKTA